MWPMWQLTKVDKKRGGLAEATILFGVPTAESHRGAMGCFWSQQSRGAVLACLAGLMSAVPGVDTRMNQCVQTARWSGWERTKVWRPGVMWSQFHRCQHPPSPVMLTYTGGLCERKGVNTALSCAGGLASRCLSPCAACCLWVPCGSWVSGVASITLFPQTEVSETAPPQPCLLP